MAGLSGGRSPVSGVASAHAELRHEDAAVRAGPEDDLPGLAIFGLKSDIAPSMVLGIGFMTKLVVGNAATARLWPDRRRAWVILPAHPRGGF